MSNQYAREAALEGEIDDLISKSLDPQVKLSRVRSIREASFSQDKKSSSIQTILSISNTLVGTSTIILPVQYRDTGIGISMIISMGIALISTKTNILIITHNKYNELDLPETILRILGLKWKIIFNFSNIFLLWISGMIYMILICQQIYSIVSIIFDHLSVNHSNQEDISFSQISFQWIGIIYFFLSLPLLLQKNLGFLLKLIPFGVVSIICYFLFIIYEGIYNLSKNGSQIFNEIKWFSSDIPTIAGIFTLAFTIQSLIVPICKNNRVQRNNKRDISIAYIWTWLLYQLIGVFGAIAITGLQKKIGTKGNSVLDYFETLFFLQLSLVYPVLQFIVRSQFFSLFYGLEEPPKWQYYGFSLFYGVSCLIVQMFNTPLTLLISLCGAVIGLFHVYIIPIGLHMSCYYQKQSKIQLSLVHQQIQRESARQFLSESSQYMDNPDLSKFFSDNDIDLSCNDHTEEKQRMNKVNRFIIYSLIISIGIYVAIATVVQILIN